MPRLATLTFVMIVALALAIPQAASAKSCKDAYIRNPDGSVYARTHLLLAFRTTCTTARRVARRWMEGQDTASGPGRPLGFRCVRFPDGSGAECRKGRASVSWGSH